MCDLVSTVASRPARIGETLVATSFYGTSTSGLAGKSTPDEGRLSVNRVPSLMKLGFSTPAKAGRPEGAFWRWPVQQA
jgi:hypothetical protein